MCSRIWKPCVDRLKQVELTYELESRGLLYSTVVDMRVSVRNIFRPDFETTFKEPPYSVPFADDAAAVILGLAELDVLSNTFDGDTKHPSYRRISALLSYLVRRIKRSVPADDTDTVEKNRLWLRLANVQSKLEQIMRRLSRPSVTLASPRVSVYSTPDTSVASSDSDSDGAATPVIPVSVMKPVPVAQWGLKFSGGPESSVSAFLERVEELRVARNVSEKQLYESAVDLFSDDALLWFRSVRLEISDWEELQIRVRRAFMPADYDDQLNNEIFHRLQGDNERPTLYVAAMRRLYQRLRQPPPAPEQLRRILKNLLPTYAQALALTDISTFDELQVCLERLEQTSSQNRRFRTRFSSATVLEPDLACKERTVTPSVRRYQPSRPSVPRTSEVHLTNAVNRGNVSSSRSPVTNLKCWNCGEPGHTYPKCSRPRKRFCYRCGRPDLLVTTCPKCSKRSGKRIWRRSNRVISPLVNVPLTLISEIPFSGLDEKPRTILDFVLSSARDDERPFLSVEIFGVKMLGLLDSGASRTILGKPGWDQLRPLGVTLLPSNIKQCMVANGEMCEVIGVLCLPVVLQKQAKLIEIYVVPSVPNCLILGVDFWRKMGVVPDLRTNAWEFSPIPTLELSSLNDKVDLTSDQTSQLMTYLHELDEAFDDKLGCTNLVQHEIVTTAEPIKQRYYPISPALQRQVDQELDHMLRDGVVEPSQSPWSSPILMVRKKDNTYRFCVDFRKVNRVTKKDAYPLPYVSAILDRLRDAKYISSLDLKSAYWQVPMKPESRPVTAFTVPNRGLFQFTRMPFGLHNAPATWQRLIDRVIGADLEPHVFVYLDDIIIVTPDFEKHFVVLKEVLRRLKAAGLNISKEKCHFCRPELKYLGYVVNKDGLHVDPDKVAAIVNFPVPTTVPEVRRLLGMASWYRRFIPNFSSVVAPITKLTRKHARFSWDESCQDAFIAIQEALISAPILSCPDFTKPFCIQTDASDYGLGAVLTQSCEEGDRVISYISYSLKKAERKYSTTEKECLAVLWAIEKFRPYIEGAHFTVITDHHSLIWLNNLKDPSGRLARWSVRLQQYDYEIIHRKGKDHAVPDALSRSVPVLEPLQVDPDNEFKTEDKWYLTLRNKITSRPDDFPGWRISGQKIYKYLPSRSRDFDDTVASWKMVVPKDHRKVLLQENHDLPTAGHAGTFKTYERLANCYYWPKMKSDVCRYVRRCTTCSAQKVEQRRPAGLMAPRARPTRPWQILCIDIVGPLPRSRKGNCYILVIADCFTKYACFFPMRRATAVEVARLVEENIFLVYGTPQYIISDNGVQFRSREFTSLCEKYRSKILFNARYHPQANPAERINRVLKTMISSYVGDNQRDWDKYLAHIGCAIRTAKHEVTSYTPYFANYGREHILYGDQFKVPSDLSEELNPTTKTPENTKSCFERLRTDILKRLRSAYSKSKLRYDLRRRFVTFNRGDAVWKRNYVLSSAADYFSAKLAPKFVGPLTVVEKLSPWTYRLENEQGLDAGVWHVKDLKPYDNV